MVYKHASVPGTLIVGPANKPIFTHAMQHGARVTAAVVATVDGISVRDWNPWERYAIDAGYCLDAPTLLPAGAHEAHSENQVFSKETWRQHG